MAEPSRVKELLKKIKAGAKRGNIQQDDVEEALSDETFLTTDGLLTADDNGVQLAFIAWAILQWNLLQTLLGPHKVWSYERSVLI